MGQEKLIIQTSSITVDNVNKTRFYFPLDEKLIGAKIKKIEYVTGNYTGFKTPNNKWAASIINLGKTFLTIVDNSGSEVVNNCPVSALLKDNNNLSKVLFNDVVIEWTRSYIDISNNASLVANTEFLFTVYYTKR
jgi:hypothetical protein